MFYILAFLSVIFILAKIEKFCWGTYFTPLNFLMIPLSIVTGISIITSYTIPGYYHFYLPSLWVWMVGYLLFAIPSWILSPKEKRAKVPFSQYITSCRDSSKDTRIYKVLEILIILLLGISFIRMRSVAGSASWGSDDFSENYANTGGMLLSHLSVLSNALFSYFIYEIRKRKKSAIIICLLCLIVMYTFGVKSWIIGPCLIGYTARILAHKNRFSYKSCILIAVGGMAVFALSYILLMVVSGRTEMNENFLNFLSNHFLSYLTTGTLTFSIDYQHGIYEPYMLKSLFAPIVNIYNQFSGDELVVQLNPIWVSYGPGAGNVRSFFGTIYAYLNGGLGFVLVTVSFSFYFTLLYRMSYYSSNPFILLASSTNLGLLLLGFFDFYWTTLAAYEMAIMQLLLAFFYKYFPNDYVAQYFMKGKRSFIGRKNCNVQS